MCNHCHTLKLAIAKGERLYEAGFDQRTTNQLKIFVETLRAELARLEARLDHEQH